MGFAERAGTFHGDGVPKDGFKEGVALLGFLFSGQRPRGFLHTVPHDDGWSNRMKREGIYLPRLGLLAPLKDEKVGKSSGTKDLEEGHRITVMAAYRVPMGARGKRPQPIIKNGS